MKKDRLKKNPFASVAQEAKRDRPRYERAKKEIIMKTPNLKLREAKKRSLREDKKRHPYGSSLRNI